MDRNKEIKDKPRISVIIPVYNCESFIKKCLLSIVNNSYRELEVICVDDGSSDNSLSIIKEIAEQDPRIIVIEKTNGGVSSARHLALQRATGEFLSFIDSDDWVHHAFFEILMNEMDDDCDIVFCKMQNYTQEVDEKPIKKIIKKKYTANEAMKVRNAYTYVHSRLIRAACFGDRRFNENLRCSEDILINYQIIPECRMIKELDARLYYRYVREESLIHTIKAEQVIPVMEAFVQLSEKETYTDTLLLKRAYRTVLSGRYKNKITRRSTVYPEMKRLIHRLKKQGARLPRRERVVYNILLDYPCVFSSLSFLRKIVRKLLAVVKWFIHDVSRSVALLF